MIPPAPRIHVLGVVSLNGGDAAILEAQVLVLRRRWPDAEIVVHDRDPEAAARYLPELRFAPPLLRQIGEPRWAKRFRGAAPAWQAAVLLSARAAAATRLRCLRPACLRRMDLAVYTGGTSLTENYRLAPKVADLELVRRAGVPYAFLPQSAGPFERAENRAALAPVLAGAALVMLRDERSLRHVLDVGAPARRCVVVPDVVFALAREELGEPPAGGGGEDGERPERLAVSVREWHHFTTRSPQEGRRSVVDAFRTMVTTLVRERGIHVTFVSTCQGRPEYTHDDSLFAAEIADGLPDDVRTSVEVDRALHDAAALVQRLAGFDALVSMRLHAAILGVCSALPTLTVAYEYKSTEVWRQLEMQEWTLDLEDLDAAGLTDRARALLDRRAQVRAHLAPRVTAFRERALALGDDLADALEDQPRRRAASTSARRYALR